MWRFFAVVAVVFAVGSSAKAEEPRPNFVVIVAEAQAWVDTASTPNLERLASEGMRFVQGYAASPRCTPSRAALLTGKSPARLDVTFVGGPRGRTAQPSQPLVEPWFTTDLPRDEVTYAELLRDAGYATAHFGKWHVTRRDLPSNHGFGVHDGANNNGGPLDEEHPSRSQVFAVADRGVAFMTEAVAAGRPFALQVDYYHTEREADATLDTLDALRRQGLRGRRLGAAAAMADHDASVGRLLDALDELGVAGNTYVLYTSDHGSPGANNNGMLAGGKGRLTEGGIRVPFLVRGPGVEPGSSANTPVVGTDWLPTVAELLGIDKLPADLDGVSFAPVLRDPTREVHREILFHFPHYDGDPDGPAAAIRRGDHILIRHFGPVRVQLYDVAADPGQTRDLADSMPQLRDDLLAALDTALRDADAQIPTANANYDPSAPSAERRRNRQREGRGSRRQRR